MQKGLFVTATGTDIGKTFVCGAIAAAIKGRGIRVGVVKPVASGGIIGANGRLISEDATFLMSAAGIGEERRLQVNPVCLQPALTPAVAAAECGVTIEPAQLVNVCQAMLAKSELTLIEGVGGILAPIWQDYLVADMMLELKLPGLLITRPDLGTINHTVLTTEYACQRGIKLAGIIINRWDEDKVTVLERSNLAYIERLTGLPVLGKLPSAVIAAPDLASMEWLGELAEQHLAIDDIISLMTGVEEIA